MAAGDRSCTTRPCAEGQAPPISCMARAGPGWVRSQRAVSSWSSLGPQSPAPSSSLQRRDPHGHSGGVTSVTLGRRTPWGPPGSASCHPVQPLCSRGPSLSLAPPRDPAAGPSSSRPPGGARPGPPRASEASTWQLARAQPGVTGLCLPEKRRRLILGFAVKAGQACHSAVGRGGCAAVFRQNF